MSRRFRGTEIFKPLNTGWIDGHVACVREWVANIFFYRKGNTTVMIDAGYNYDRLAEKMGWLGIAPGRTFATSSSPIRTPTASALAEDNALAVRSLAALEEKLASRGIRPLFITGHTGWTDNFSFAFAHKSELCAPFKKRVHDPAAPYDAYEEADDTEAKAKSGYLAGVGR